MKEQGRLRELTAYKILDTAPEKELDELAEIASAICDTPISLLSFVDDKRQWFKAKKGIDAQETPREYAFCQHALQNPQEVLVVDNPLHDARFKDNPLVTGDPHIRFYAGAPLETAQGHVLGTLCIIDNKPRTITDAQKNALRLLAKKAMNYLETRKLLIEQSNEIESNAASLKKLTDQAPVAIYQFEMKPTGELSFPFISKGIIDIHASFTPEKLKYNPAHVFSVVHPDDLESLRQGITLSGLTLNIWRAEFRVVSDEGKVSWVSGNSRPEQKEDGTVVWYGIFKDVTERREYIKTLEQILFDISHVMRRPVATMLGLTAAIEKDDMDEKTLRTFIRHIKTVSEEMDAYIRKLNADYNETRVKVTSNTISDFVI
ncbi:MAG: hypothetical protein COW65_12555 [Cytophagales bacterium CG18_big_fil_WC_8_21_14_2_50_42_9]|nr:MAG: hypothetical protein COW65_12555 [Cytophagales bacterium CG18_big_fil_WC_8_21_14_2_50_42_9]